MSLQRVTVELGKRSYPVIVGHGARSELSHVIPDTARRAVIVTQRNIDFHVDLDLPSVNVFIGDGEKYKSLSVIEEVSRAFARASLTRHDVVVGVGGGMVTDVAGFAAASWHRGTPVVHVATSLVGMIDAAIGGKTGVNLPEGKNLVGAFWQPAAVICDLDALSTLPEREMRCGLGEMAKYHFLSGDDLLALDQSARIVRCVEIKAKIVSADERESGMRAVLNYGHTLAHAIEVSTEFRMAHGESVAIGMVFAAHLAAVLGRIDQQRVQQHECVIRDTYGLDVALPNGCSVDELIDLMLSDKKAVNGLTFVLDGEFGIEPVSGISRANVVEAFKSMELL
ncbi:MAG: 3-dehydroquinate synthase family protein [Ilumatobacteraceae bacterium]